MLTNCPECNHEVSDQAHSCPNCGHPFAQRDVTFIKKVTKKTNLKYCGFWNPEDTTLSYMKIGILGLSIFLTVYGLIFNSYLVSAGIVIFLFLEVLILAEKGIYYGYPYYRNFRYFPPRVIKYRILRRRRRRLMPPKKKHDEESEKELRNTQIIEPLTPDDL